MCRSRFSAFRRSLCAIGLLSLFLAAPSPGLAAASAFSARSRVSSSDFVSLDDAGMLDPRGPGGALPMTDFLRPAPGGNLVDVGVDLGLPFEGTAPDIGPFEHTP